MVNFRKVPRCFPIWHSFEGCPLSSCSGKDPRSPVVWGNQSHVRSIRWPQWLGDMLPAVRCRAAQKLKHPDQTMSDCFLCLRDFTFLHLGDLVLVQNQCDFFILSIHRFDPLRIRILGWLLATCRSCGHSYVFVEEVKPKYIDVPLKGLQVPGVLMHELVQCCVHSQWLVTRLLPWLQVVHKTPVKEWHHTDLVHLSPIICAWLTSNDGM
jgi:hypothetical protein